MNRLALVIALSGWTLLAQAPAPLRQTVIRTFKEWANQWTGPHWNFHAPMVVVDGDMVVASTSDTEEGCTGPLDGASWRLFWRRDGIWRSNPPEAVQCQREPCPIARIAPGRMVLFSNPGTAGGASRPELRFYRLDPAKGPQFERSLPLPIPPDARMTPYSYRGLAADPSTGSFLLTILDNQGPERTRWFYGTDKDGFIKQGILPFPDRGCYPYLVLNQRRAAVLAVQDIPEPVEEWRKRKLAATGSTWDYVFRRLYLTTCPDLARSDFQPAQVLDDVARTGGMLQGMDLAMDANGTVQVLFRRQQTTSLMRKLVFPNVPDKATVEWREFNAKGAALRQATLPDPEPGQELTWARLCALPSGGFTMLATSTSTASGQKTQRNWLLRLSPEVGGFQPLATDPVLDQFFLANGRGGNVPGVAAEAMGTASFQGILQGVSLPLR